MRLHGVVLNYLSTGTTLPIYLLYTVGSTPCTGDQPVARPLPIHRTTQAQNKLTQTSMPRVGFEPTIAVFKRTRTVHVLDGAATVIGNLLSYSEEMKVALCHLHAVRVSVNPPPPPLTFECLNQFLWNCYIRHLSPSELHTSENPPINLRDCVSPSYRC
jgi:hypothetical protein